MEFTLAFLEKLIFGIYLTLPPLLLFCSLIVFIGLMVGYKEGWNKFDSIYWAFITALTVGYGDIRPVKKSSKILAIFVAVMGIMLFGIIVAITVETFTQAFQEHIKLP